MNCSDFDKRATHVLLGQESQAVTARWNAHRDACPRCAASAARVNELLRAIRAADAPATSARFRAQLRSRLEFIRAEERAGRLRVLEEAGTTWAWLRRSVRSSNAVKIALAAAAVVLVALLATAWNGGFDATAPERDVATAPATDATAERHTPTNPPAIDPSPAHPDRGAGIPEAHGAADPDATKTASTAESERDRALDEALAGAPTSPPDILQTHGAAGRGTSFASVRDLLRHRLPGEATTAAPPAIVASSTSRAKSWLLDQQQDDGSFDPARGGGRAQARVGVTALALLALESTPGASTGVVARSIDRGVAWLLDSQDRNGTFGESSSSEAMTLFNHAAATLVLSKRFAHDGGAFEQQLADAVLRLDDLDRQRGARAAVDGDVVAARFAALALEAAREAHVPTVLNLERVVARVRAEHEGRVDPSWFRRGEFPPEDQLQAAVTASMVDPWDPSAPAVRVKALPVPTVLDVLDRPDLREASLLYCTTLDLAARPSSGWETYRQRLTSTLMKTRQKNGSFHSAYTFDSVGAAGGTLYETALAVLTLRVPER